MKPGQPSDPFDDFAATPYIAGAFTGRRTFKMVRLDGGEIQLWGPIYAHDWSTDDVNDAWCHRGTSTLTATPTFPGFVPQHQVASMDCTCGFWAYFKETDHTRTYRYSATSDENQFGMEGIIFGFGRATAGTLGFRCAKARILALVIPDHLEEKHEPLMLDAMNKYTDNRHFRWFGTMDAALAAFPLSSKPHLEPPDQ